MLLVLNVRMPSKASLYMQYLHRRLHFPVNSIVNWLHLNVSSLYGVSAPTNFVIVGQQRSFSSWINSKILLSDGIFSIIELNSYSSRESSNRASRHLWASLSSCTTFPVPVSYRYVYREVVNSFPSLLYSRVLFISHSFSIFSYSISFCYYLSDPNYRNLSPVFAKRTADSKYFHVE